MNTIVNNGGAMVVGLKQTRKAILSGIATCVYLASDADPAVIEPIAAVCQQQGVEIRQVETMRELGEACGIRIGAAAAAAVSA